MSRALTNSLRNEMKRKTKQALYEPRKEAIENEIVQTISSFFESPENFPSLEIANAVSTAEKAGYIDRVTNIQLDFAGFYFYLTFEKWFIAPVRFKRLGGKLCLSDNDLDKLPVLKEALKPILTRYQQLEKEWEEIRTEISCLLHSVNTVKKLIEAWPDVLTYVPELTSEKPITALVVNTEELNRRISSFAGGSHE